jgi:NitT/TauT family transport system permease protein
MVYTAMLGAALLGLVVAGFVSLLELPLMRHRRQVEVVTL